MISPKPCDLCGKFVFADDMVTITAVRYSELLSQAAAVEAADGVKNPFRLRSHSPIARSPALAAFILECRQTMTILETFRAVEAKFGRETTSKSSIFRFWKALKQGL